MAKKTTKKKISKKTTKKKISKKTATTKRTTKKKVARKKTTAKKVATKTSKKAVSKSSTKKAAKATAVPSLKLNEKVPDFSLKSSEGTEVSLSSLRGKKVVLFFYPKDSTSGCTLESQQFSQLKEQFLAKNAVIYGISRDSLKSHENFIGKYDLKVSLLSDPEELACQIFGVIKEKNMYGKMVMGVERSTFVIDEEGRLIKEWRKVTADGHAAAVLQEI